ncbi:hypothetical protein [Bifidobacterium longum]|uniref:hypothetical protein n=1 Tax=Bifidobacterium longum TaxID=216816 RepID=UPI001A9866B3|nr:hypothetical protein [Bifidobacterium longum]QSZ16859.1 hypothetical protein BLL053_10530 [Bifidobacterium longum subsp. longum]
MRNIIRIGARHRTAGNRFVAIALGVALAVGPAVALPAAALAAPATDARGREHGRPARPSHCKAQTEQAWPATRSTSTR